MKSKVKYYAQVIGVNLLAALVPILAVILIYGFGKVKNIYTHPAIISQEIYDCCLEATIVVLAGFSVGLFLLGWADRWRKAKLMILKARMKRKEEEEAARILCSEFGTEPKIVGGVPDSYSDDGVYKISDKGLEFENTSDLSAYEIWLNYEGRMVYVEDPSGNDCVGYIAGYIENLLIVAFDYGIGSNFDDIIRKIKDVLKQNYFVKAGYASYLREYPDDVHVIKMQ